MKARSLIFAALAVLTSPAFAQSDVVGKWLANIDTQNGPVELVFEFMPDTAGKLVGSMQNAFTGSTPIQDVTVNGKALTFKLTLSGPGGSMTVNYQGTINDDEITLSSKLENPPPGGGPADRTFTARRTE